MAKLREVEQARDELRLDNVDEPVVTTGREEGGERKGMGRRAFLRAGLAGAAVAAGSTVLGERADAAEAPVCEGDSHSDPACDCATSVLAEPGVIDPKTAFETWNEPWTWRPSDWPGQQLDLNVVENQDPGINVGLGNPGSVIFSYGSNTPGPTIRMTGDEILYVKLRNLLGQNLGTTAIGPNPDVNAVPSWLADDPSQIPNDVRSDFCLGEHTNGLHAAHTTNLHTHGLHVRPDRNPNGTHSDNVILRVIPQKDLVRREQNADDPSCQFLRKPSEIYFLRDDETAGQADYEFRLGDVMGDPNQPHPPGTHWYHPHSHGATHNQVSSGMAGFLIVEGDVDEAVNEFFTGDAKSDPSLATGPLNYRERLMFMQRVNVANESLDPNSADPDVRRPTALPLVNGSNSPAVITMQPGAVERWRIINGSVDGRGYKHFMVVEGQYDVVTIVDEKTGKTLGDRLCKIGRNKDGKVTHTCVTLDMLDPPSGGPKQQLWQLAFDGVTLVDEEGHYTIKDLAKQRAGTANPLAAPLVGNPNPNVCLLKNLENVFRDAESIRNTWVRPNEVYLGPANRSDVFFQAPNHKGHDYETEPKVYTVLAKAALIHADTPLRALQRSIQSNPDATELFFGPTDIVLAHIVVRPDKNLEPISKSFDPDGLRRCLPTAPPYLKPVRPEELELTKAERKVKPKAEKYRTRTIRYSGVGADGFPLFIAPDEDTKKFPKLKNLTYTASPQQNSPTNLFVSPNIRTMAIDGRKFNPSDAKRPQAYVILNEEEEGGHAAEEWALFNETPTLWGNTTPDRVEPGTKRTKEERDPLSPRYKQPDYQFGLHYESFPISKREGFEGYAENTDFQVVSRAIDHPFHQHQNPFWVMRIEIPDQDGNLVNILDQPRWQDVVWIPRSGGRVVFRSRFPDFVGTWVNHCHILLHEDNGMMQVVQGTPFADEANYTTADALADAGFDSPDRTNQLYPPPTLGGMYRRSLAFVDSNHDSGQKFPLPSYFDPDGNLIEEKIPVPELP